MGEGKPQGSERDFLVRALGEVAIRCDDLPAMIDFYEDILGLKRLPGNAAGNIVFFEFGESFGGHTQVLALFAKDANVRDGLHPASAEAPETGARSSLHHIALSLPFEEQDAVMRWYEANSLSYRVEWFNWIGWRGVFTTDPDGNTVELVARDPSFKFPAP